MENITTTHPATITNGRTVRRAFRLLTAGRILTEKIVFQPSRVSTAIAGATETIERRNPASPKSPYLTKIECNRNNTRKTDVISDKDQERNPRNKPRMNGTIKTTPANSWLRWA